MIFLKICTKSCNLKSIISILDIVRYDNCLLHSLSTCIKAEDKTRELTMRMDGALGLQGSQQCNQKFAKPFVFP